MKLSQILAVLALLILAFFLLRGLFKASNRPPTDNPPPDQYGGIDHGSP